MNGNALKLTAIAHACVVATMPLLAQKPDDIEFFEKKIRPVLSQQCYACHSAASKPLQGGLQVDSRDGLLKGGGSGSAVVPNDPSKSLLLAAIKQTGSLKMP